MNIIPMMNEVLSIANPVIRKSALPDFGTAPDERAEFVGIGTLDELHGPLNRYVLSGSKQKVNVIGHENESVQEISPFAAVMVKRFEKEPGMVFDLKKPSILPASNCYEVGSGRRKQSRRPQERTSAAESRSSS